MEQQDPELEDITDDLALERSIQGDSEAFSILYERYVRRIYNYIYYRTGNQADAEDLTERVFYRALGNIRSYIMRGVPFSAWLYRIAHNLVANWYRDNSRNREVPLEDREMPINRALHPEHEIIDYQEREKLLSAIRKLPEDRQQLIILKFVEHLSNNEVAVIMGRSEGAIKSLYHRTLLALRDDISPE
jgi:RNA polymerase sigma-70 factor (ECF subfamily)